MIAMGLDWGDIDPYELEYITQVQGGADFITDEGLLYQLRFQYDGLRYAIQTEIPSTEEVKLVRAGYRLSEEDPLHVMKGSVWIEGYDKPFTAYGSASPTNLQKSFIKFPEYGFEMADTRARNRALRLAVGAGTAESELPDAGKPSTGMQERTQGGQTRRSSKKAAPSKKPAKKQPEYATDQQLEALGNRVSSILDAGALTSEQANKFYDEINAGNIAMPRFGELQNSLTKVYKKWSDAQAESPPEGEGEQPDDDLPF